jgi:hypothetical protein
LTSAVLAFAQVPSWLTSEALSGFLECPSYSCVHPYRPFYKSVALPPTVLLARADALLLLHPPSAFAAVQVDPEVPCIQHEFSSMNHVAMCVYKQKLQKANWGLHTVSRNLPSCSVFLTTPLALTSPERIEALLLFGSAWYGWTYGSIMHSAGAIVLLTARIYLTSTISVHLYAPMGFLTMSRGRSSAAQYLVLCVFLVPSTRGGLGAVPGEGLCSAVWQLQLPQHGVPTCCTPLSHR